MRTIAKTFSAQYRWVKPSGTYGAMAEGLRDLSENDYVIFLNATDWFAGEKTLELTVAEINDAHERGESFHWGLGKTPVHDKGAWRVGGFQKLCRAFIRRNHALLNQML